MTACLHIVDADDTLRRTTVRGKPCPHAPEEWELIPGVRERLAEIRWGADGALLAIASSQDQVAYGHLTHDMAHRLLADLLRAAAGEVSPAPAIRFCPPALHVECRCRKPAPGMLLDIVRHSGVAPGEALFVGNAPTDRQAAARAGIPFAWAHEFFGCER